MSGVIKLGMEILEHSAYVAIPTDKDGGFALVRRLAYADALRNTLRSSWYREVALYDHAADLIDETADMVIEAARRVAWIMVDDDEERSSFHRSLCSGFRFGTAGLVSRLQGLVKSHKPPGSVVMRPVHASTGHPAIGMMRFIAAQLRDHVINDLPFILRDTDHLLELLSTKKIGASSVLLPFDVKDFFMSGRAHELCADATGSVKDGRTKRALETAISTVLATQLITVPDGGTSVYSVAVGTGMGLPCSGEISDSAFYNRIEKETVGDPRFLERFKIDLYVRFKDDGLFVLPPGSVLEIKKAFTSRAKYFTIEWGDPGEKVPMLDVLLYKGWRWRHTGLLDYRLYTKPTSIWLPLSPSSMHRETVHFGWPRAAVCRIRKRCHSRVIGDEEVAKFTEQLNSVTFPEYAETILSKSGVVRPVEDRSRIRFVSRIILPFSWDWQFADLNSVLRSLRDRMACLGFDIQIAWSNGGRHLHQALRGMVFRESPSRMSIFSR